MKTVATDGAPRAIGPYSQAVSDGDFLFLSGQIPLDPATGEELDAIAKEVMTAPPDVVERVKKLIGM